MGKGVASFVACVCAVLIEGSLTTTPLVVMVVILLFILRRKQTAFIYAFICGIVLDVMLLRPVGETNLFLLPMLFLISLYQRKFEIYSLPFVALALFAGSYLYTYIFVRQDVLIQSFVVSILGTSCFMFFAMLKERKHDIRLV